MKQKCVGVRPCFFLKTKFRREVIHVLCHFVMLRAFLLCSFFIVFFMYCIALVMVVTLVAMILQVRLKFSHPLLNNKVNWFFTVFLLECAVTYVSIDLNLFCHSCCILLNSCLVLLCITCDKNLFSYIIIPQ